MMIFKQKDHLASGILLGIILTLLVQIALNKLPFILPVTTVEAAQSSQAQAQIAEFEYLQNKVTQLQGQLQVEQVRQASKATAQQTSLAVMLILSSVFVGLFIVLAPFIALVIVRRTRLRK